MHQNIAETDPRPEGIAQECCPSRERRLAGEQQKSTWNRDGRQHGDDETADHGVPVIQ